GMATSVETFRRHLELLREQYEVLTLDEASRVLRGERRVSRAAVVITLDDGYRDVYDQAWPVLRALSMPATVFVPTAFIGTSQVLDHDRIDWLMLKARNCGLGLRDLVAEAGLGSDKGRWSRATRDPLSFADHLIHLPLALRESVLMRLEARLG